ncbi:MAG: glycosyltransferase family 4 protein [Acidobacteriota bacterium]|jgi:glycosyltransferase involved in cell wall biosynthesis
MKILFPYMSRWRSANRSRYHQLMTHLCRRGHEVLILTAPPMALSDISSRDIAEERELPPGLVISELFAPALLRQFWQMDIPRTKLIKKGLISISSIPQLRRVIAKERIDLLFLYNLPQVLLMEVAGCPVHFDLADDLVAMMEGEDRHLFRYGGRLAADRVQRWMLERAHSVTVASSVLADQISRPLLMLPNGADLAELDSLREDEVAESGRAERLVIGFVGALEYWVDLELLVEVADRRRDCDLLIVGGGRRLAELQAMIERRGLPNITLTGPKAYREAMREVSRMDICLLPFTHSPVSDGSCPLKLFEYAALEKPIISTRTTEVGRIGEGWIHFADQADEFAEMIEMIRTQPALIRTATRRGRSLVEDRYNWPTLAATFDDYISQTITAPPHR